MTADASLEHALDATDKPLASACTLPAPVYRDQDCFDFDCGELFRAAWIFVGHRNDVSRAGDYSRIDVGRDSFVLCRDDAGQLHLFHNCCRHRGTQLVDSTAGRCRRFVCPYHGWTYELDGTLRAASTLPPGIETSDFGLVPLELGDWHGLVFANATGGASPLSERFGDFPDIAGLDLATQRTLAQRRYEVRANWKLIVENFNECYHCSLAHPALHRLSRGRADSGVVQRGRHFTGGPMPLTDAAETLSRGGRFAGPPRDGSSSAERRRIDYYHLFPNLLLSVAPDYVMTHAVWPRTPDTSDVVTAWYATPAQLAGGGYDPTPVIDFWDETNRQDWALCERAQRGVSSGGYRPGPYHPDEQCVHDFDRWYARAVLQALDQPARSTS